jgi:hypothetical protein
METAHMKIFKTLPGLMLMLIFLVAPGCGSSIFDSLENKDTDEATAFEVSKRLDEGDYDYVLSLGENANPIDYAAAALGAAGIDIPTMISSLTTASEGSTSLDSIFAMTSGTDSLDELKDATDYLTTALEADPENTALNLQLTLVSLATVTTSISQVADNNNISGVDTTDGLDSTELSTLGTAIGTAGTDTSVDTNGDGSGDTELATIVGTGIDGVSGSLGGSGLDESGGMSELLTASTDALSGDSGVTNDSISSYLTGS